MKIDKRPPIKTKFDLCSTYGAAQIKLDFILRDRKIRLFLYA
ncbi:hypothetical protein APA_921 [Pseudanabaena sp. lw0831]|nr:hypothetical protein APA_921 [Pseudanabaena sp. lw0831]